MIKLFVRPSVASLKRKYDQLMHESYLISKVDPEKGMKRQMQALAVQRDIVRRNQ